MDKIHKSRKSTSLAAKYAYHNKVRKTGNVGTAVYSFWHVCNKKNWRVLVKFVDTFKV
jgi:hypothetical protein